MALIWTDTLDNLDNLDWHELADLYRVAPLGGRHAQGLQVAFTNSRYRCFVHDDGQLVGVGRVLADGVDCAYICDVALLPSHQGLGLGKQIVARLVELSRGHRKIILYAVPGKEDFYRQFGFRRMSTAMAIFEDPAQARAQGYLDEH